MQAVRMPLYLALDKAGNNIAARMAMIAITTSNSINVKPGFEPLPDSKQLRSSRRSQGSGRAESLPGPGLLVLRHRGVRLHHLHPRRVMDLSEAGAREQRARCL